MLQDCVAAGSGCHLCNVRLQVPRCSRLPILQYGSRQRPGRWLYSKVQQQAVRVSSRGRSIGVQVHCVQALERPTQESKGATSPHSPSAKPQQREVPASSIRTEDLVLPEYDRRTGDVELIVAGAGPSGLAVAERVSQAGISCRPFSVGTSAWQTIPAYIMWDNPEMAQKALTYCAGSAGFRVCIVDPTPLAHWPNNYGERPAKLLIVLLPTAQYRWRLSLSDMWV